MIHYARQSLNLNEDKELMKTNWNSENKFTVMNEEEAEQTMYTWYLHKPMNGGNSKKNMFKTNVMLNIPWQHY